MKKIEVPKAGIHWITDRMNSGERPIFLKIPPSITSIWRGRFPSGVHNGSYFHIIPSGKQDIFELRIFIDPVMRPEIPNPVEVDRDFVNKIVEICEKAKGVIPPEERMSYYGR